LLGWVVRQAQQARCLDEVVVVLGRAADEIRGSVDFGNARVVDNPVFGEGCASSYKAGLSVLDPSSDAIMIILGDQPGVSPEILDRVADCSRQSDAGIVLASYRGRKGHPMVFSEAFFEQLAGLHGDKAAWKLVDANPSLVKLVELDLDFPDDIDTMDDFRRLTEI
jgi:molybdenum cofactor cytidylyltransferase